MKVAEQLDERDQHNQDKLAQLPIPECASPVALYDAPTLELNALLDGVLVKVQKPSRGPDSARVRKFQELNFALIPKTESSWEGICAAPNGELASRMRNTMAKHWSEHDSLNVVTLTDGARQLRNARAQAFGEHSPQLLDWYHLQKKVGDLTGMFSYGKKQKEQRVKKILKWLWRGRARTVVKYLEELEATEVRQPKFRDKLMNYLEKHAKEIPDYEARQSAGKLLGSGRMEQGVNQWVSLRQKKKGMSWSMKGSRALAQLTLADYNEQWNLVEDCLAA